jgi:hypothetical protein
MATIDERKKKDGSLAYRCSIRRKGIEIQKTFLTREDAELFAFFKERLAINMENFDVPVSQRVRLIDIIELKKREINDPRTLKELESSHERVMNHIKPHMFLCELTLQDWAECMKKISLLSVPVRSKSIALVNISLSSIRRIFATLSSAFSYAIHKGIALENYPLQIIQKYINPSLNNVTGE